jgi:aldehyde dehydrogenase (NAD+)
VRDETRFYIDGQWSSPAGRTRIEVINPATEEVAGQVLAGTAADVDAAVAAARRAFPAFAALPLAERVGYLEAIIEGYKARWADIASAITEEMGAPKKLAQQAQAGAGMAHLQTALKVLQGFAFEEQRGPTRIVKEPIGVCGFITPWNWPMNQLTTKLAPALAVGCTVVLKPSEVAPFSAHILAEIIHDAGLPPGVFNLVDGDGPTVGAAIAAHPGIDMVSFTGSTRAGIEVARAAAPTVKRVAQELGGKSPNIVLEDADFGRAVTGGVRAVMMNSGQSCNAPTRMLVPQGRMEEVVEIARRAAEATVAGDPQGDAAIGPVVSQAQWDKVQRLIEAGVSEGARLVAGGPGRPEGLNRGYYVRPTVFADVTPDMTIAREEIFGPVLSILAYRDVEEAVAIANDTEYGLAAYVSGGDLAKVREVGSRLRAGQVSLNGAGGDFMAPFGGYKQSGNGREWGDYAFHEFLEVKAMLGYEPVPAGGKPPG